MDGTRDLVMHSLLQHWKMWYKKHRLCVLHRWFQPFFLIVTAFATPYYCVECANPVFREQIHVYCGLLYFFDCCPKLTSIGCTASLWLTLVVRCSCYIININICDGSWWHLPLGCYSKVIELWCKIDWSYSITALRFTEVVVPSYQKGWQLRHKH